MSKEKRILLVNSFAVNNGDMALVIALYDQLKSRGYVVSIATFYYKYLIEKYPELPLVRELLDYPIKGGTFVRRIFLAVNFFFNKKFKNHNIFIAAPGGYVNSYYGLKRCLLPLVHAKRLGKKTAIYSQSVGPLNERDRRLLTRYSKSIDTILVRDDYSMECISSVECFSKVRQTKDAAFLIPPRKSTAGENCRRVAVSVRSWEFDDRSMEHYTAMIVALSKLVLDSGFDIEFISTCQGVRHYRDDSKVAETIRERLLTKVNVVYDRVVVNSDYHTYYQLSDRLNSQYAFVIGTRLHMCILSLINGVPAFNISYEVKGRECYDYLNLEDYTIDFNETIETAVSKFKGFIDSHVTIRASLTDKLKPVHQESIESLELFLRDMNI